MLVDILDGLLDVLGYVKEEGPETLPVVMGIGAEGWFLCQ